MDRAVSFGRALLNLARAQASGLVYVEGGLEKRQLLLHEGRALTISGSDHALGDVLVQAGDLDLDAHRSLLPTRPPDVPVGTWLVASGVTSPESLTRGLRTQLRNRIVDMFSWPQLSYRFCARELRVNGEAERGESSVHLADLVLRGIRSVLAGQPRTRLQQLVGSAALRLNSSGRHLLLHATCDSQELAVLGALAQGTRARDLISGASEPDQGLVLLSALRLLGGLEEPRRGSARSYALLVKKQRELRRRAGPDTLLELPRDAGPKAARRALRRLANSLHPDRFGPNAPEPVRAASTEVMSALCDAEYARRS